MPIRPENHDQSTSKSERQRCPATWPDGGVDAGPDNPRAQCVLDADHPGRRHSLVRPCPDCGGRLRLHVIDRLAGTQVYRCDDCTARIETSTSDQEATP